jgi:hypothetical protein
LAQADPATLQIRVTEGEGAIYATGSRATRGITVHVTDGAGRAVEGVSVTFRLPEDGSTGTFSSGERAETQTTRAAGEAQVWGMEWNRTAGPIDVRITAVKGNARAGIVTRVHLTGALRATPIDAGNPPSMGGHKKLWILVGLAAAAAAGVAVSSGAKSSSGAAPPAISAPRIGAPSITIGRP